MELNDKVIILKPFTLADAEAHLAGEDEEQIRWLGEGHKSTIESVKNWIQNSQKSWNGGGTVFVFAIWSIEDCRLVGMVEANTEYEKIEGLQKGDVNISYAIYPDARGRGYASRAVSLVMNFLKKKQFARSVLRISPDNINSLKIPNTFGFENTGEIITKEGKMILFVKNF